MEAATANNQWYLFMVYVVISSQIFESLGQHQRPRGSSSLLAFLGPGSEGVHLSRQLIIHLARVLKLSPALYLTVLLALSQSANPLVASEASHLLLGAAHLPVIHVTPPVLRGLLYFVRSHDPSPLRIDSRARANEIVIQCRSPLSLVAAPQQVTYSSALTKLLLLDSVCGETCLTPPAA
jgi:hypothetical protein